MALRVTTTITGVVGGPWINVMAFQGTTSTNAQDAATAVRAFWLSASSEMKSGGSIKVGPYVDEFNITTGKINQQFLTTTDAIAVTAAGTMLPTATQARIDLKTGAFVNGREVKGKIFLPGFDESRNDSGLPNSALLNNLQTWINTLVADANSVLAVYSVAHRNLYPVDSGIPWPQWAVLRSRRS